MIHVLFYGGFRTHGDFSNSGTVALWILGLSIVCTVNCFALISGFVLYGQKLKYMGILRMLLSVLYHGIFITAAFQIFMPDAVDPYNWIQALFPVSQYEFWYFSAYFGVFLFAPVLIRGMEVMPKKQATFLVICLIVVFSLIPTAAGADPFGTNLGYSVLWILILFVTGTYLRKYHRSFSIRKPVLLCIFGGCILITCLGLFVSVLNPAVNGMGLMEYTSPTIVVAAIALVLLFSTLEIPVPIQKFSLSCVSLTFGIYVVHEHPLVRRYIMEDRFLPVMELPAVAQILAVVGITVGIWLICFALEWLRQQIFRLLRVEQHLRKLEDLLQAWFSDSPEVP
jgi:surface polysaccharide O-acyltransferase-like enzyme